jgi:aldehyde:ferredoxin oxidoreductase
VFGSIGKLLRVNLSEARITVELLSECVLQRFLGGKGLGAKILFDELKPMVTPFGVDNKLVFATGPLTGASFPGSTRYVVMAKSPVTEGWGESHAAGWFGMELKKAGFDCIVVEGVSEVPVLLWVKDGEAGLQNARKLWGKSTGETQAAIRKEMHDDKVRVAAIGQAGERLVRYASIISDLHCAAGRCGMGAVMGSKRLKAVAVRGTGAIPVADPEALQRLAKVAASEALDGWGTELKLYGTDGALDNLNSSGRLPTKAFTKCTFEGAEQITGETMAKTILKRPASCPFCPSAHYRIVEAAGRFATALEYGGPEYETCAAFGSLCMNSNLEAIAKASELCNKYALDTIATGVCIAFAMECYEKGLITKKDADGLDLSWGNADAVVTLVQKIAFREGIGNVLAEGVKRAAEQIGGGSEAWALHVKGAEVPMHEPRGKKGMGLTYATSDRGASHLQVYHDDSFENKQNLAPEIGIDDMLVPQSRLETGPRKVKLVKINEDLMALYNSLVVCRFVFYPAGVKIKTLLEIYKAVTGNSITSSELMKVGERAFNLTRAFNAREGFSRSDDTLPPRLQEPLDEGPLKGEAYHTNVLNQMLDQYYELRGWSTETGRPTKATLKRLGLDDIAEALHANGLLP